MQGFDSDATYCSQAEKILTQPSTQPGKADRSLFRNVRRSQRLLQQSTKNKINLNWANIRCKMTQSPLYSRKMRLRRRSQSSTQFHHSTETGVCSSPVDLSKPVQLLQNSAENLDFKYMKIKESIDLMAEFETEAFANKIPLNQKHFLDTLAHASNQTTKDATKIDLTQTSSNPILKKSTKGRPRKKDACVIDLTLDAGKLPAGDGHINRSQRKTKAKEHLCDIEPKIAKIEKFRLSSPTTSAFLMSSDDIKCKDRKNNKQANFDKQGELWNQFDAVATPPRTAENSKMKYKVDRVNNGLKKTKSNLRQSTKAKQIKSRRKMSTSTRKKTKLRNEMITKYVNLADFVEENEADKRKKRFKLHPSCPTNSGSYEPPPPIPTKPVPLLRSVANSILPKVYPPHFIHQKPPIEINHSIPYEKTHVREMHAFRRTRPNSYIPFHQSPVFEHKPKIPMDNTPVSMFCTDASPNPNKTYTSPPRVPKSSVSPVTPEKHGETNCLTPELTQQLDGEVTTSTSPSLPESLKGIFDSDDLRQILNVDKIEYKLCDNHVKALAIVLNIRVENLREVLKNIVKLDQEVLKKIESAMKATPKEPNAKEKQDAGCFVRNLISPVADLEDSKNTNARQSSFPNRRHRM